MNSIFDWLNKPVSGYGAIFPGQILDRSATIRDYPARYYPGVTPRLARYKRPLNPFIAITATERSRQV